MKELLLVLFGWALGLLSPLVVDFCREWRQRKNFLASALVELRDVQFVLATMAFLLVMKHGRLTTELVEKTANVMNCYHGNEPVEDMRRHLDGVREMSQQQLDQLAAIADQREAASGVKIVKPSYVMSNLSELAKLKPDLQRRFYELFRTLDVIEQEVRKVDALILMTFDSSISEENHNTIGSEIKSKYIFLARQCERAVDKIEGIIAQTP